MGLVKGGAYQYGTTTRLPYAVNASLVTEGWSIDQDTSIDIAWGTATVHGLGSACRALPPRQLPHRRNRQYWWYHMDKPVEWPDPNTGVERFLL